MSVSNIEKRPVNVFKRTYNRELKKSEKILSCVGLFHGFSVDFEEFEGGPGNFACALVELPNGEVITPPADLIQFTDVPK